MVSHRAEPDLVVAARRNLPLVVGLGDGENFVGSDVTAFIAHTREARAVDQDQVVEVRRDGVVVTDLDGTVVEGESYHVDWDTDAAEKGGYDFFMLKEIQEQPQAVRDTLGGRLTPEGTLHLDELSMSDEDVRGIEQVVIIACGSSYHSGLIGKYAIERWCRLPVQVEMASEFRYRDPVVGRSTLVIAISQSGETADTLEAVRHARSQRAKVLAVTNTLGSTISRESDAALYTRAGPEVAVASTKAVIAQITAMYLVGLYLAQVRGTRDADEVRAHLADLQEVPDLITEVLTPHGAGARARPRHRRAPSGCCSSAATSATRWRSRARSSSRSWRTSPPRASRPARSSTGRSRSSTRAPRSSSSRRGTPCRPSSSTTCRRSAPAAPARSSWSPTGTRASTPYADDVIALPDTKSLLTPLLTIVPLQVLSAEVAIARGLDVDQPRNLAKSVTVE